LALPSGSGLVTAVRSGHPVPGTTRIVFDLSDKVAALRPRFEPGSNGPRLVLEWPGDGAAVAAASAAVPATPATDPLAILTQGAVTSAQANQPPQVSQPVGATAAPAVAPPPKAADVLPQPAVMRPLVIAI